MSNGVIVSSCTEKYGWLWFSKQLGLQDPNISYPNICQKDTFLTYVFPLKTMSMSVYKSGSADSAPQTCYELSLSCVAGKGNGKK